MTYEYECRKHGHRFEVQQRITDPPLPRCTVEVERSIGARRWIARCNSKVRRLVYAPPFQLLGKSWGRDGYK